MRFGEQARLVRPWLDRQPEFPHRKVVLASKPHHSGVDPEVAFLVVEGLFADGAVEGFAGEGRADGHHERRDGAAGLSDGKDVGIAD